MKKTGLFFGVAVMCAVLFACGSIAQTQQYISGVNATASSELTRSTYQRYANNTTDGVGRNTIVMLAFAGMGLVYRRRR